MLSQHTLRLECTELGDAHDGKESENIRRPTPPAENRGEPNEEVPQPHDTNTPSQLRMTDDRRKDEPTCRERQKGTRARTATSGSTPSTTMTRGVEEKEGMIIHNNPRPLRRNNKPLYKHFRITHLNCRRNREALNELTKIRARDDVLLASETPVRDGIPVQLAGYTSIHHVEEPRICAYVRDRALQYIETHTTGPDEVELVFTDNRTVRGIYLPHNKPQTLTTKPMKLGDIVMGDTNAHHPEWDENVEKMNTNGKAVYEWSIREGATESSPPGPTHIRGYKIDLVFTKDQYPIVTKIMHNGSVENSDHDCQSIMIPLRIPITTTTQTLKTNYARVNTNDLTETIKTMKLPIPDTPGELIAQLDKIKDTLPKRIIKPTTRLAKDVLEKRRDLRHARERRQDPETIRQKRLDYRQSIRDSDNTQIVQALEESDEKGTFFELSKRGQKKMAIPTLRDDDGREWRTHGEIAERLARHHLAGEISTENPSPTPDIPKVSFGEVSDAINKAPSDSTLGEDDIGITLLKSYHRAMPTSIPTIFTDILTTGIHPREWKKAIVVPIPKANKARYDQPKAWRSLHLLSLVSKTLERVVLSRLQDEGETHETLGPTQFGSRRNTGTSDAMTILLEWKKMAEANGDKVTIMVADVEGGFDKVNPSAFRRRETQVEKKYTEWIYNWTQNRELQFRFNDRTDTRVYTTNTGLPQGSPLSPYLFGAYVKEILTGNRQDAEDGTLLISYVDDVAICIRGKDDSEVAMKAARTWNDMKDRATLKGMSFAENKTKTWHSDGDTNRWHIGQSTKDLRFLGYWLEARPEDKDSDQTTEGEQFRKHVQHWLTKANYTYNKLRALTQRTSGGLKTFACLRLLHAVTRTIAWYGIEFYADKPERTKEVDSFMYEATKRLFDMPFATPHRALSAEFALTPTAIQARYVTRRITTRRTRYHAIMDKARHHARLPEPPPPLPPPTVTATTQEPPLPYTREIPIPRGPYIRQIDVRHLEAIRKIESTVHPRSIIAYTDGSETINTDCSFAAILYTPEGNLIAQENGRLSPGKTILDAETTAIYHAMTMAMNTATDLTVYERETKRIMRHVIILSDSKAAINKIVEPERQGPTAYLNAMREEVENHEERPHTVFHIGWIKGHAKIRGNEAADRLAKSATDIKDPYPGTSPTFITKANTNSRQKEWEEWFDLRTHEYRGKPSRRLKKHKGLSRLDSTVLFKIRSNKGWKPDDNLGVAPPPDCGTCNLPDDGRHKLVCPRWTTERPTDIETIMHDIKRQADTVKWIRHHKHFGIKNKIYEARFIRLKIGNYNRDTDFPCPDCPYITSNKFCYTSHRATHAKNSSVRTHVDPATLVCPQCGKISQSRSHHDIHMGKHTRAANTGILAHACPTPGCEYSTASITAMYAHKSYHHVPQTCKQCSFTCIGKNRLVVHQKASCAKDPPRPAPPPITDNDASSSSSNTTHPLFKCDEDGCDYESPLVANLRTHVYYYHRTLTCHGCSKTFLGRGKLRIHQRTNCGGSRS